MEQTTTHILSQLEDEICMQADEGLERLDMERLMTVSPWGRRHTERCFREHYLTSPARYFRDRQAQVARELLAAGDDVLSASTQSGFASPGRLHDAITTRYGLTPGEVRRRAAGVKITFGFFETPVGVVWMAATERGLCSLQLCGAAPTPDQLAERIATFQAEYPQADLNESPDAIQSYADQLVAFLEARSPDFCPPLDILQGTTFQREVWAALQRLEPGETVTYTQLADRIGRPKAVRAVASACARNNVAIAIPCHRVIRQDGLLAGYRWGIEWKERLLEIEAEMQLSNA